MSQKVKVVTVGGLTMAGQKDDGHIVLGHTAEPVKAFQDIPARCLLIEQYPGMDLAKQPSLLGSEKPGELPGVLMSEVQVVTGIGITAHPHGKNEEPAFQRVGTHAA
jgi:hypothetical protein